MPPPTLFDVDDAHRRSKHGERVIPATYVATCELGVMISLSASALALGGRADHKVFHNTVVCYSDTNATVGVYATGKVVIVGCKTAEHAYLAAHRLAAQITTLLATPCNPFNLRICNMICRVEFEVRYKQNK